MKKIAGIFLLLILVGCAEPFEHPEKETVVSPLTIANSVGIRLESMFVVDEVKVNVKTDLKGPYIIVITDIVGKIVAKETITLEKGDNIITLFTRAIPIAGYRLALQTQQGVQLGITDFNKIN